MGKLELESGGTDVQRCRDVHWCPARGGVHFMLGLVKTWEKQWKQRVPTKTQTETNTKSKGQEKKVTTARA